MSSLFLSYRQNDSPGDCRQLCERLQDHFGHDNVFFDIQSIRLGDNWWKVAQERIRTCDFLLVVVGQTWATIKDKTGRRRLDDPRDPLRMELALALRENIRTIPVFVEGASMPGAEQLPEEIRDFADLNGFELRHSSFRRDVDALIEALSGESGVSRPTPTPGVALPARQPPGQSYMPPPSANSPPLAQALNLTGVWQSPNGLLHQVWQQGTVIGVESRNALGIIVMRGQGTLNGNLLCLYYEACYQPPFTVRGEARGMVSPDGRFITGQSVDPTVGMQQVQMQRVG